MFSQPLVVQFTDYVGLSYTMAIHQLNRLSRLVYPWTSQSLGLLVRPCGVVATTQRVVLRVSLLFCVCLHSSLVFWFLSLLSDNVVRRLPDGTLNQIFRGLLNVDYTLGLSHIPDIISGSANTPAAYYWSTQVIIFFRTKLNNCITIFVWRWSSSLVV